MNVKYPIKCGIDDTLVKMSIGLNPMNQTANIGKKL